MYHFDINSFFRQFLYNPAEPLIFNSGLFLFLFTGFLFVFSSLTTNHRAKLIFVTLFSLYFYYKSSGVYVVLLISVTIADFFLAWFIYNSREKWRKKLGIALTLLFNLGILGYFKYTNFLYESFFWNAATEFQPLDIFLPVGVSFFTFQSLSYTIDTYRGHIKPVNSILDYAFFVSFFPQLVAGPIVRAADFIPQIHKASIVTKEMFGRGVFLIGCGLFKKAIISDYISINFVDRIFDAPTLYSGIENLLAVYGYALQIYCDFSGYSDMAIGIALLLGFHFPLNFNAPYRSQSITEFWRRWHISLSTWLRDYLYISLGGNRKGWINTHFNQFVTMLLGGLWHGASWRFIIWGALHGLGLIIHKQFNRWTSDDKGTNEKSSKYSSAINTIITFHFVCFCWIFFRANSLQSISDMINQITHNLNLQLLVEVVVGYKGVMFLMLIGYLMHFVPDRFETKFKSTITESPLAVKAGFILVIIIIVIQTKSAGIQPFIYFQF